MQLSEPLKEWGREKTALRNPDQGCSCLISQQWMDKCCDLQIKPFPVAGGSLRLHLCSSLAGCSCSKAFLLI